MVVHSAVLGAARAREALVRDLVLLSCRGDSACSGLVLCLAVSRSRASQGEAGTRRPSHLGGCSSRLGLPAPRQLAVFSCPGFVRFGGSGAPELGYPKPGGAPRSPRPHSWASAVSTRVDPALSVQSPDMDAVPLWSPLSLLILLLLSGTRGERSGQEPGRVVGQGLACAKLQPWPLFSPHRFGHQPLRSLGTHLPWVSAWSQASDSARASQSHLAEPLGYFLCSQASQLEEARGEPRDSPLGLSRS